MVPIDSPPPRSRTPHARAHILVVEDHDVAREALETLLSGEGYECVAVADGEEALQAFRSRPLDLLLLDIDMPGKSGLSVLEVVRQTRTPIELPVIMVTGRDAPESVVTALGLGANDYVTKPLETHVLLARIRTQLQVRDLSRVKDQFLSIASHDLKSPLAAIRMAAELLRDSLRQPEHPEDTDYLVDVILRGTGRMRRLISDFLDLGAIEGGRVTLDRVPLELGQLASEAVRDHGALAREKDIWLAVEPAEAPTPVLGDPERLAQVIDNLVGNALKFSPSGTQVQLRTFRTDVAAGLEVRDNGPGLKPEDFPQLFAKHVRLSNRPTGGEHSSGLGLFICKLLVEQHGGRIGARNGPDGGAVFWFELPLRAP
jgi:signal transduction histidine kinase